MQFIYLCVYFQQNSVKQQRILAPCLSILLHNRLHIFHTSFAFCSPLLSLLQRWPSSSAIWPFPLQPSNSLGQHPRWMRDSSSALVLFARGSAQVAACRQASLVSMTEGESTGWARVSRLLFRPLTCVIIFLAAEQTTVTDN